MIENTHKPDSIDDGTSAAGLLATADRRLHEGETLGHNQVVGPKRTKRVQSASLSGTFEAACRATGLSGSMDATLVPKLMSSRPRPSIRDRNPVTPPLMRLCTSAAILGLSCPPGGAESLANDQPIVIAHRGASGHAPEHTLQAYDLAIELGADYIEQDLQLTRDGVLVVFHDEELDRIARGPGKTCSGLIRERTLAELRLCDVGRWFNESYPQAAKAEYTGATIPTLEEVFERYGRSVRYYIETKQPDAAPGMEEKLVELLQRYGLLPKERHDRQVLVQSFSPASLRRLKGLAPTLPLIQLFSKDRISPRLDRALRRVATYAVGIGPSRVNLTPELVATAHGYGLHVHPYTVNEVDEMRALVAMGVDGIFTDYPDRLISLRP